MAGKTKPQPDYDHETDPADFAPDPEAADAVEEVLPASITDLVAAFLDSERAAAPDPGDELTFLDSVRAFLAASPWIGPEHMPAVVALKRIATQLDGELTAALAGQFGVTFRDLRSQAPATTDEDDPVELALRARENGAT